MVSRCKEAAEILRGRGISAEVINVSTIKPLDTETIIRSASKTKHVVTAENSTVIGGLGGAVAEVLSEKCGESESKTDSDIPGLLMNFWKSII